MSAEKIRQSMENLGRALDRLNEALQEERTEFMIDATIQRFEFCIELFWKTLKRQLEYEGIEATTPRETMKHAYKNGWLREETLWIDMLDDRNRTSHIYNEEMANEIYDHIKDYHKELAHTYQFLADRYSDLLQ